MTQSPLRQAVERSFPNARHHEADERVLLVDTSDELAAINTPGIKAVIWEREMPGDIAAALQRVESCWNIFARHAHKGCVRATVRGRHAHEACAKATIRDKEALTRVFENATGRKNVGARLFEKIKATTPHRDGFHARMVVVYTAVPEGGTQWYPGDLSHEDEAGLKRRLLSPSNDSAAIKREYRFQHVPPGHVLVMKGLGNPREEQLIHNGQDLGGNRYRRILLAGALV